MTQSFSSSWKISSACLPKCLAIFKAPKSDRKELSFAAGVAAFGMILRDSEYKGTADFDMAYELVGKGLDNDPHGYRAELQELITTAKGIAFKQ